MGKVAFIERLDRFSVNSPLRGSTASLCGLLGTLIVVLLTIVYYAPAFLNVQKGEYYTTEYFVYDIWGKDFYSDVDFKIAIQWRHKQTLQTANHTAMKEYLEIYAYELIGDWTQRYREYLLPCDPTYFADAVNPVTLDDCLIFPRRALMDVHYDLGDWTYLLLAMLSKDDPNPFAGIANTLNGQETLFDAFMDDYFATMYFTSKLVDPSGKEYFEVHRAYSTDLQTSEEVEGSVNWVNWVARNSSYEMSIYPGGDIKQKVDLVWLGDFDWQYILGTNEAARFGLGTYFNVDRSQIVSYRYYKKIDFVFGLIGGAMLLFYLIAWLPCNFINKTLHQMRNTEALLLVHTGREDDPVLQDDLQKAHIPLTYFFSNPLTNMFFDSLDQQNKMVTEAERELDIVTLIKKIKITERTLSKKNLITKFEPRFLDITEVDRDLSDANFNPQMSQEPSLNNDGESHMMEEFQGEEVYKVKDEELIEEEVDSTFGLTALEHETLKMKEAQEVYQNNMTAMALAGNEDQTNFLKEQDNMDHNKGYKKERKLGRCKWLFQQACKVVKWFDVFGVKPNLSTSPMSGSLCGFFIVVIIIVLSILTVAWTLANANNVQHQVLLGFDEESSFSHTYKTGSNLNMAVCSSHRWALAGNDRYAEIKFFMESSSGNREELEAVEITANDYPEFDIDEENSEVWLERYCYTIERQREITMSNDHYFGFVIQPYCASTPAFCQANADDDIEDFLVFMNSTLVLLMLPQNRYDPNADKLINNLVPHDLHMNERFMKEGTAYEETVFVDRAVQMDDTTNWFMRTGAKVKDEGIAVSPNTPHPLSRNIPTSSPYYQVLIKPSSMHVEYVQETRKADSLLAMIGGVFVFWYAIFHCFAKGYNHYNIRGQLARDLYDEDNVDENPILKFLALLPIPTCLFCCAGLKNDIMRVRQVDKKMNSVLSYLWLVKATDNCFRLSTSLFRRIQERYLSMVFVKEKVDEAMEVRPEAHLVEEVEAEDFDDTVLYGTQETFFSSRNKPSAGDKRRVLNESTGALGEIDEKMGAMQDFDEKIMEEAALFAKNKERLNDNHYSGHPQKKFWSFFDIFEYQSSLTIKGKREATSVCGGCCFLILLMFICIIASFEVSVYLDRDDEKHGIAYEMMQPTDAEESGDHNNHIRLTTGSNFRLGVTFSTAYQDYPHDISTWIANGLGVSLFKRTNQRTNGSNVETLTEHEMFPCNSDYFTSWLSTLVDPMYYKDSHLGYCVPDGLELLLDGLPQDEFHHSFVVSVFDRSGVNNSNVRHFMQEYLPVYHFSSANADATKGTVEYEIMSLAMDPFNVSYPVQHNVSLSKMLIEDDGHDGNRPGEFSETYIVNRFRQKETSDVAEYGRHYYYNLTFDNSHLVQRHTVRGDKFYETWGIIGGLVAFFVFGFATLARSFNQYKLNYAIARQLYLFDIRKKKEARARARGKNRKTREQIKELSHANNLNEAELLWAYICSFAGALVQDYNLTQTLRRVSLLQQFVEKDLCIYNTYKNLYHFQDILGKELGSDLPPGSASLTHLYPKHIYKPHPNDHSFLEGNALKKLKGYAQKHNWTAFEVFSIVEALKARVDLRTVFDNAFLAKEFDITNPTSAAVYLSQLAGTVGSIGTDSAGPSEIMSRQEEPED